MAIRVVLADDHTMVRDALAGLLAARGDIDVVGLASDGREAVERVIASRPDVAVLDVSMPVLNGIEAAAQIRKLVPGCRVVALSALADDCFVKQMVNAGARGYILKSESGERLADTLTQVAAGRTCLPAQPPTQARPAKSLLSRREG